MWTFLLPYVMNHNSKLGIEWVTACIEKSSHEKEKREKVIMWEWWLNVGMNLVKVESTEYDENDEAV